MAHLASLRARRHRLAITVMLPIALLSCVAGGDGSQLDTSRSMATGDTNTLPRSANAAPVPTAPSFVAALGQRDRMRATLCLASAVYYEAANEPDEGQRAVAQVVLNRVRHREWPQTICGVVYQGSQRPGCQFSFACDGAMARGPMLSAWIRARHVAERALAGEVFAPVGSATFYHTRAVAPAWSRRMTPVAVVGAHIFYRMPSDPADARALPMLYAGNEPRPGPLPHVAPRLHLFAVTMPLAVTPLTRVHALPAPQIAHQSAMSLSDGRYIPGALPDSHVRDEFRDSGQWIAN